MTWLYMPPETLRAAAETHACSGSPSAPASAGSTSGLSIACPRISYCGLRRTGNLRRGHCSWRGWKTRPWIRLPVWDDVATFDGRPWRGAVDIVAAGYPCQPFSVAGRRLAAADPRHLWPHVARIVGEVEPPFVFLENVAHHLRLGFPEVAGDLVGMGYRLAAGLFTAAEVGAPHRRERLFILAHPRG